MSENVQFLRFAPPGHFYSPTPDIKEIRSNSELIFDRSVREIPGIDMNEDRQLSLAKEFISFYGAIPFPDQKRDDTRYYFENDYYSYGDGCCLYSLMRLVKPKRIVEVGSGFSSAAMLDTNDRCFRGEIDFTFIEPYPDRLLSLLGNEDRKRCSILEQPIQQVPMGIFHRLYENDILFIDSSHVAKTHSDVLHILFTILPSLRAGVLIHFHDILWPFEYPRMWLERGRAWNEASGIGARFHSE
jgi:predicted O-methyltransferase YrrM